MDLKIKESASINRGYKVIVRRKVLYEMIKRILDIVLSIAGLIFTFPILLWVAIRIYIEEPGAPIFFSQERVGKDKRAFKMYKFRSMCVDAEKNWRNYSIKMK